MRLCTYIVKVQPDAVGNDSTVLIESPGLLEEKGWEIVKIEPVSEGKSRLPPLAPGANHEIMFAQRLSDPNGCR